MSSSSSTRRDFAAQALSSPTTTVLGRSSPSPASASTSVAISPTTTGQRPASSHRAHSNPAVLPPIIQPSSDKAAKYGLKETSFAPCSTMPSPTKSNTETLEDPLRGSRAAYPTRGGGGKVPYGPGFYIPPPGYQATSSFGVPYHLRADVAGRSKKAAKMEELVSPGCGLRGDQAVRERFDAVQSSAISPSTQAPNHQKKYRARAYVSTRKRIESSSTPFARLARCAVLAVLLATTQLLLLSHYDHHSSTTPSAARTALSYATLCMSLYAAFLSILAIAVESIRRHPIPHSDSSPKPRAKKRSAVGSLTDAFARSSALLVCLSAAFQLAGVIVYALRAGDNAVKRSVLLTLLIATLSTLAFVLYAFATGSHLNRRHRRHSQPATLPFAHEPPSSPVPPTPRSRSRSRSSSASSHAGIYVPDYDLDSDTDSSLNEGNNPKANRPRPDWTDEALKGLIRSPLLDGPKGLA